MSTNINKYVKLKTATLIPQAVVGYDFEGFFSISVSALVVSLGIKLTGFQGFFSACQGCVHT